MKPTRRVVFAVEYNPKLYVEMSRIVRNLDLGITNVSSKVEEIWSYKTTSEVDDGYEKKMEGAIMDAIESTGNQFVSAKIIRIEFCNEQ